MSTTKDLWRGLRLLGVDRAVDAIYNAETYELACARLRALQAKAKTTFRKLAFTLHPDRTNNDKDKTAKFILATNAMAHVDSLTVNESRYRRSPPLKRTPPSKPVVQPPPPIPWDQFSPAEVEYIKRVVKRRGANSCYFLCTSATCVHGSFRE